MATITSDAVVRILSRQLGLITWSQALGADVSPSAVKRAVRGGHWVRLHRGVYALAGIRLTPEVVSLAACLATGGRCSHRSAAWLWALIDRAPARPAVTVEARGNNVRPGITIHRAASLWPVKAPLVGGIPCTVPLQTIVDLATIATPVELDAALDRALARRLVTVGRLDAHLATLTGRPGVQALRSTLRRRGYTGGPHPSVLESQMLRLLIGAGIVPLACEQPVGAYRVDFLLADHLALEVDGYAYHADPAALRRDLRRRRELRAQGWTVLVYTWLDVRDEPERIIEEVRAALACHRAA